MNKQGIVVLRNTAFPVFLYRIRVSKGITNITFDTRTFTGKILREVCTAVRRRPLVSIVIPTYNRRDLIGRALESVFSQSYGRENMEVIVVDDGSTDDTMEYIAQKYGEKVICVKNMGGKGPAGARNYGAALAKGEFIAFQDSDDEWDAAKLEKQMEILLADKELKMVYCGIVRYRGEKFLGCVPDASVPPEHREGELFDILLERPMISTQTMLLNKEAFWAVGGFDETLQSYEDYEFSIRFAREYRIGYAADTSVKVYDYENSVNKRWAEQIRTQIYILRKWYDEFLGRGLLLYTICQIQLEGYVGGHMLFAMNELKRKKKYEQLWNCRNVRICCRKCSRMKPRRTMT